LLAVGVVGKPQCIDVEIRERWDGIFSAHPWLSGPEDTYLGFWKRGGGACGEHSHGINLWQNLAYTLGLGRVREVTANMKMSQVGKAEYDESCFINLQTEFGHVGRVVQDVVTFPVKCWARVQGDKGFIECIKGYTSKGDLVRYQKGNDNQVEKFIEKNRPDDFRQEVEAIQNILEGRTLIECSPTSLDRGLETMLVVAAAHKSHREKRTVRIEYGKGFCLDALV
ncbi:MAG: gfo/Idh/MocA family oxidoreductase, partial [Parcubacteria group bacterium]|nr:gfo/Idh/MocA family oxidoreductase [Parcubacteria group bacterium]